MRVLETCIYAPDLAAERQFYEGLLGLECFVFHPPRQAFFRADEGVFLIFNPEETQKETDLPPHGASGSVHVCFARAAKELGPLAEKLTEAGYTPVWANWKNGRSFYVYDPAGNLVEFAPGQIWGLSD